MVVLYSGTLIGESLPLGYSVPAMTVSPDGRFGVIVPLSVDAERIKTPHNALVEIATGKEIGVINAAPIYDFNNHRHLVPTLWTPTDSFMLWRVDGRWGYDAEVLIKLKNKLVGSQINISDLIQRAILERTMRALPKEYDEVKKHSIGYGPWFKDGFAIDCVPETERGVLTFPLKYQVFLGSNVKHLPNRPNVETRMTAEVGMDGTLIVTSFSIGNNPRARLW